MAITILTWLAALVFGLYTYDLLVSLAGFLPLSAPSGPEDRHRRFAILVCAHDEERVVADVVRTVLGQQYPSDKREVFVVADNCSDATAEVARAAGATVMVRKDAENRTKGYALQWGMERLIARGGYDALCVFDADNLVAPTFLAIMNRYLAAGHVAIQAYLDTKNPDETWVTRCIALAYYVTNRFWLRARARLGLPATLGGTGFCVAWSIVEKYRWDAGSLADDLELTMKLILDGVRVSYSCHTRTFDEKPLTLGQSLRQRSRWMQGHHDVALRWIVPMARATLRRRSIRCFDALLHLLQPIRLLVAFLLLLLIVTALAVDPDHAALGRALHFTIPAWSLAGALYVVYPVLVAAAEGRLGMALRSLPSFLLFGFTWIPAAAIGLARVRRRVWVHTTHGGAAGRLPSGRVAEGQAQRANGERDCHGGGPGGRAVPEAGGTEVRPSAGGGGAEE